MSRDRLVRPTPAGSLAAVLAGVLALGIAGCDDRTEEATAPPAPLESPVDAATAGRLSGRVVLTGTPPAAEVINRYADPYCAALGEARTETYRTGRDGGLRNAFVYVKDGLADLRFPVPTDPVVLDQRGCTYAPRVLGIQAGQPLDILNSDDTLHNVHAAPELNRTFNLGQGMQGVRNTRVFTTPEVMVPFQCDVHDWMRAWVGVLDHPFYAVSGADGTFAIDGLPPGSYTIEAWHEALGTQTQAVTLGPSESVALALVFEVPGT